MLTLAPHQTTWAQPPSPEELGHPRPRSPLSDVELQHLPSFPPLAPFLEQGRGTAFLFVVTALYPQGESAPSTPRLPHFWGKYFTCISHRCPFSHGDSCEQTTQSRTSPSDPRRAGSPPPPAPCPSRQLACSSVPVPGFLASCSGGITPGLPEPQSCIYVNF